MIQLMPQGCPINTIILFDIIYLLIMLSQTNIYSLSLQGTCHLKKSERFIRVLFFVKMLAQQLHTTGYCTTTKYGKERVNFFSEVFGLCCQHPLEAVLSV